MLSRSRIYRLHGLFGYMSIVVSLLPRMSRLKPKLDVSMFIPQVLPMTVVGPFVSLLMTPHGPAGGGLTLKGWIGLSLGMAVLLQVKPRPDMAKRPIFLFMSVSIHLLECLPLMTRVGW